MALEIVAARQVDQRIGWSGDVGKSRSSRSNWAEARA